MELAPQQLAFDYNSLDSDTARLAKESAIEIKAREKAIWENIIEIGNRLIEVKAALPHGSFGDWIDKEFDWSKDTAQKIHENSQELGQYTESSRFFPKGKDALYRLASALTKKDDTAKEQILEQVAEATEKKGKPLTEKEIKELPLVQKLQEEKARLEQEKELLENQQLQLLEDKENAEKKANRFSSLYGQETDKAKEIERENATLKEQLKELEKLKAESKELEQKMAEQLKTQIELAIKESTAEVEQKKTATNKRITELEIEISKLEGRKENLEFYTKRAQERLDVNHNMEKRHHELAQILQKFEDISRSMHAEQRYILSTPTPELMTSYKALAGQFKLWAEIMGDAIALMENAHQGIIDITITE